MEIFVFFMNVEWCIFIANESKLSISRWVQSGQKYKLDFDSRCELLVLCTFTARWWCGWRSKKGTTTISTMAIIDYQRDSIPSVFLTQTASSPITFCWSCIMELLVGCVCGRKPVVIAFRLTQINHQYCYYYYLLLTPPVAILLIQRWALFYFYYYYSLTRIITLQKWSCQINPSSKKQVSYMTWPGWSCKDKLL